jgi:predicted RNA-binding Zn ribbon-like protein
MNEHAEPLAVRLANTTYAERGELREWFETTTRLRGWLTDQSLPHAVTSTDLPAFRGLRDAARRLLDSVVTETAPAPADVSLLNDAIAAAPTWPELVVRRGVTQAHEQTLASERDAALAALARSVVDVVTSPTRDRLRACGGPGCVLFFEQTGRRGWCSAACGNRARVARHYQRSRSGV